MKKIYLLCIALISLQYSYSQLVVLDEAPEGINGVFNDLVVYDNDIIYNKSIDGTTYSPRVFLNYGEANNSINIHPNQNHAIRLKQDVPDFLLRQFYDGGYYQAGKKIFGQAIQNNSSNSTTVFQLNKSRTMFNSNGFGLKSLDKVGRQTVVGRDTILNAPNSYYAVKVVQPNLDKLVKIPAPIYENNGSYGNFFLYNNTLHYTASLLGKGELYADNGFGESIRITNLQSGSIGTAVRYPTPASDGIWFNGVNRISTGSSIQDRGFELCYTNGSPDLNAPPALGFGYIPFETGIIGTNGAYNGSSPVIFGEVNNKIIYYAGNTGMRKIYAHPGNVDLNVPSFVFTDNGSTNFGILNNKMYIVTRFNSNGFGTPPVKLIILDGTPSGTQILDFPEFVGGAQQIIHKNAIYFIINNNFTTHKIIKFNPIPQTFETLFEGSGFINQVTPYQDGFVFTQQQSTIAPYGRKLMGWNIEKRQLIHDPNNTSKSAKKLAATSYSLNYNSVNYDVVIDNVTMPTPDKIKIQLLDENSSQKEYIIGNFPENTNEINSDIFYAVNTLEDGNNHISEISFGYNEAMFPNITSFDPFNLKLYLLQNDIAQEIPAIIDTASKTLKVNTNFEDESFVYFAYANASLSVDDNSLSHSFSVYPNPTNSEIHIKSNLLGDEIKINILNILGKSVLSTKNTKNINVSGLPSGMYFIQIEQNNQIFTRKFIKK